MLEWLKKKVRKDEADSSDIPLNLERNSLVELGELVVSTALMSTSPINDAWAEVVGDVPMSAKSNFVVRCEMLWFFLHMLNRYAFAAGGPGARAALQDAIAPVVAESMVTASFHISTAKAGFDAEDWLARMTEGAIDEMNAAEIDYASCTQFTTDSYGAPFDEQTVLGKLAGRINRTIDHDYNPDLRLLIWKTALEALAKSGLKQRVESVCKPEQ